jgi:hypothetical protein
MADVVQQRRNAHITALGVTDPHQIAALLQQRERAPRQVIRAERVLKTRMAGARIHQERQPELPHIPQPLERGRVDQSKRKRINPDVIPEWIADDFQVFGPAAFTALLA